MKNTIAIVFIIFTLITCSKDEEQSVENCNNSPGQYIAAMQDIILNIDEEYWYLERNEIGGGSVNLQLSGSVNADSASIRTYGDGLISESGIEINSSGEFDTDKVISFTATTLPEGDFNQVTFIKIYK